MEDVVRLGGVDLLLQDPLLHLDFEIVEIMVLSDVFASEFTVLVVKFVYVGDHEVDYTV